MGSKAETPTVTVTMTFEAVRMALVRRPVGLYLIGGRF